MLGLRPNPERYDLIERNGERLFFDRFDGVVIPERILTEALKKAGSMPFAFRPPRITNAIDYVTSRQSAIEESLTAPEQMIEIADPSGELLRDLSGNKLDFAILSVDLVGSTALSGKLDQSDYAAIIRTLASELAEIITLFRGHVLKFTGDGAIFFIPGPSVNQQNDLAIDCALTMRALVYLALNPILASKKLPFVDIRIGIDFGQAAVTILGSSSTKSHADLIGEVVSLACKVESTAQAGDIHVGGVAARMMHTTWRKLLEEKATPENWIYTDEEGKPYPIYRMKLNEQKSSGQSSPDRVSSDQAISESS